MKHYTEFERAEKRLKENMIIPGFYTRQVRDKNGGRLAAGLRSAALFWELVENGL